MSTFEVIGLVSSITIPFVTLYIGKVWGQKSESRKEAWLVADEYCKLRHTNYDVGISGIARAGIGSLKNESDALEALKILQKRVDKYPLGQHKEKIESIGVLKFFREYKLGENPDLVVQRLSNPGAKRTV